MDHPRRGTPGSRPPAPVAVTDPTPCPYPRPRR